MQRSLWLRRSAAVTALAISLTACGSDDPTGTTGTDGATDAATDGATDGGTDMGSHEPDGVVKFGYILPESGQLADIGLGTPQIKAVEYAISLISAAGGINGQTDIEVVTGDEAGDASLASQAAQRQLGLGVDAIIGAASSGMSASFVDAVTSAGVLQCSGSNTAPNLSDIDDNGGYYIRTAPTDALQGPVLADAIVADGHTNIAILARADDYGQGLLDSTQGALEAAGATVVASSTYDPNAATFSAEVEQVKNSGADAVVLIAFGEGGQIIKEMIESGLGPDQIALYGADGVKSDTLWEAVDPSNAAVIEGMKGTAPFFGDDEGSTFIAGLIEFAPELADATTIFAAQVYDCVNIIALAMELADSDAGQAVVDAILDVTNGGTACADFAECKALIEAGTDIDYVGATGVEFSDKGEPLSGVYEIWEIDSAGVPQTLSTTTSTL